MHVREKLVELIEQSGACFNCFPVAGYEKDEIEKIASHLIAHGVTVQEWIPVSEGLPEKWQNVLVFRGGKTIDVQFIMSTGEWSCDEEHKPVTHWMPLTKPPKGE